MSCFDEQPDGDPHGECAAEIHRLEQQRDELLAALGKIAEVCNGYDLEAGWACTHARAAIAKATGGLL